MPEYTTRRFVTLLSVTVLVGVVAIAFTPLALNRLLPTTMTYYQISTQNPDGGEPRPTPWARLNHTFIITGNRVESILQATAIMEPWPSPSNISLRLSFEPYDFGDAENLVPVVSGGALAWAGEMHLGDSVTVQTSLELQSDGRYFVGGSIGSYAPWATRPGGETRFYMDLQWGVVTHVYTDLRTPVSTEIEARCISNC